MPFTDRTRNQLHRSFARDAATGDFFVRWEETDRDGKIVKKEQRFKTKVEREQFEAKLYPKRNFVNVTATDK